MTDAKFSNFNNAGDLTIGDTVVGLRSGVNSKFNYAGASAGGSNSDVQYNNSGALDGDSAFTTNGSGTVGITGQLTVDNLRLNANTLSSENTNGDINLTPDGTGNVILSSNVGLLDTKGIIDENGNEQLIFSTTSSAINYLQIANAATGNGPSITVQGETNVDLNINAAGTGNVLFDGSDVICGNPGTEGSGININGTTYNSHLKISDIGSGNEAQLIMHRHSTTIPPIIVGACSNSNDETHAAVTNGQSLFRLYGAGWTSGHYDLFGAIDISADSTGTIGATSAPGRIRLQVSANSAQTPTTALTITNDKKSTFAGNVVIGSGAQTLTINSSTAVDEIINDNSMVTASATSLSTSESIKAYVDTVAGGGFTVVLTCLLATTANLSGTYNNGASGVGATLTNNSTQAALEIDGVTTQVNDRVLVKNQTDETENGVYTVTTVGDATTDWVLTRATDYDEASEVVPGSLVPVSSGTDNGGSIWLQTAPVSTIGTDDIVFTIFAQPATTFVTLGTTQTISGAKTFSNNVVISGSSTLDLNSTTAVDGIIDDDSMGAASDTTLATSESIKAYVDAQVSSGPPSGSIIAFAGSTPPSGYLKCNGQAVSRATYSDLFSAIGVTWGNGDGTTTFNLPNMERRTFMGSGGTGTATIGNSVGDTGGEEDHTLTTAEMPSHTHSVPLETNTGTGTAYPTGAGFTVLGSGQVSGATGGNGAHNTIQPSAVVLMCIKT